MSGGFLESSSTAGHPPFSQEPAERDLLCARTLTGVFRGFEALSDCFRVGTVVTGWVPTSALAAGSRVDAVIDDNVETGSVFGRCRSLPQIDLFATTLKIRRVSDQFGRTSQGS